MDTDRAPDAQPNTRSHNYTRRFPFVPLCPALIGIVVSMILIGCGVTDADATATHAVSRPATRTIPTPTMLAPAVATEADAIAAARQVASPYVSTWRDVIASLDGGVWRVTFRNYDAAPRSATPDDTYYRTRFTVRLDATSGIVLSVGYE